MKADQIPLIKYLLDGKISDSDRSALQGAETKPKPPKEDSTKETTKFDPLSSLPVGFRIFIKSKMNQSQLTAITASASEYGDGGYTLIKGPPG